MIFAKVKGRREETSNNCIRDPQRLRATGATLKNDDGVHEKLRTKRATDTVDESSAPFTMAERISL
ncbi:MAG: hypothetical protein KDA87_14410 [Planctomycetales bacterium]|nr:hypothetical protein [Planctomycetales bacterium]